MSMLETIRGAVEKHLAYLRTRNAIRALPLDTALDLDICPGDADRIAHRAIYG